MLFVNCFCVVIKYIIYDIAQYLEFHLMLYSYRSYIVMNRPFLPFQIRSEWARASDFLCVLCSSYWFFYVNTDKVLKAHFSSGVLINIGIPVISGHGPGFRWPKCIDPAAGSSYVVCELCFLEAFINLTLSSLHFPNAKERAKRQHLWYTAEACLIWL